MVKHFTSVVDIVNKEAVKQYTASTVLDEKIGDLVNYCILLEAILLEGLV